MRVLLIDPPFYRLIGFANRFYPMGLCSLGAYLRREGHEVAVHDHDANLGGGRYDYGNQTFAYRRFVESLGQPDHPAWTAVVEAAREFAPDVIGLSLLTPKIGAAARVGLELKRAFPCVPLVLGGTHPTVQPEETLGWGFADCVVRGEGELTMADLLRALAATPRPAHPTPFVCPDLSRIAGLSWRDSGGQIVHNPNRPLIADVDSLPDPDRDLLRHRERYSREDLGLLMTSRGCPYDCRFCSSKSIWTRRVRFRSLERVLAEVAQLRQRYGVSYLTFKDDSFTVNRRRALEYCKLHRQRFPDLPWECVTRLDLIDRRLLATMRGSGCVTVKVGVESGSPRMLAAISKGEGLTEMRRGAAALRQQGMFWSAYFIMGLPGELESDLRASQDELRRMQPDFAAIGVYEPFPGTPMFADGLAGGLYRPSMTLDEVLHTAPGDYYLVDPARRSAELDPVRFEACREAAYAVFSRHNRRPRALLRRLRARLAQYRLNPAMLVSDVRSFVSWYPHA